MQGELHNDLTFYLEALSEAWHREVDINYSALPVGQKKTEIGIC